MRQWYHGISWHRPRVYCVNGIYACTCCHMRLNRTQIINEADLSKCILKSSWTICKWALWVVYWSQLILACLTKYFITGLNPNEIRFCCYDIPNCWIITEFAHATTAEPTRHVKTCSYYLGGGKGIFQPTWIRGENHEWDGWIDTGCANEGLGVALGYILPWSTLSIPPEPACQFQWTFPSTKPYMKYISMISSIF